MFHFIDVYLYNAAEFSFRDILYVYSFICIFLTSCIVLLQGTFRLDKRMASLHVRVVTRTVHNYCS